MARAQVFSRAAAPSQMGDIDVAARQIKGGEAFFEVVGKLRHAEQVAGGMVVVIAPRLGDRFGDRFSKLRSDTRLGFAQRLNRIAFMTARRTLIPPCYTRLIRAVEAVGHR